MAARFQKYRLTWPVTASQWYQVDQMFGEISTDLIKGAAIPAVLNPTGVIAGTYGSATLIPIITVGVDGRITTITTAAVTAAKSVVTDDTTTNATMFPVWVNATPGNEQLETSSTALNWNPATRRLNIGTGGVGVLSLIGRQAIVNTQADDGFTTLNVTVTMPTVITTTRSAFNFDVTTAGSSSQITQGLVFTLEPGYTGTSPVKALVAQSSVASAGFTIGVVARVTGASLVNIGVNSFCNAGTNNIALFGGLGNTDGATFNSTQSACLMLANGTTAADLIQAYNNITKTFSVTGAGVLNAAGTIVSGNNLQCGASAFMTWNGRAAMASPADGQINFDKQSTTIGVGIDVTTDAVMKIRTRAQTGDASVTALNLGLSGLATTYNNIATVGYGHPAVFGLDSRTGLTTADGAAITLYTTINSTSVFRITADIFATAAVTGTAIYTIKWTQNGTSQSLVVNSTTINTLATGTDLINPDTATVITAQLTGTFTGTFTVTGLVEQIK